jgi:hypothetical protein
MGLERLREGTRRCLAFESLLFQSSSARAQFSNFKLFTLNDFGKNAGGGAEHHRG